MDSPPTSEPNAPTLRLLGLDGTSLEAPREWQPALLVLEMDHPFEALEHLKLRIQGEPVPLWIGRANGGFRLLAQWARRGVGRYAVDWIYRGLTGREVFAVGPEKLKPESWRQMLLDLEVRLPAAIAMGLKSAGAMSGLAIRPPGEDLLRQELILLRRAVSGVPGVRAGLAEVLISLAPDPHRHLRSEEVWLPIEKLRHPIPHRLAAALALAGNLEDPEARLFPGGRKKSGGAAAVPEGWDLHGEALLSWVKRAQDARVEHTFDVYENRLIQLFHHQAARRLRRLLRVARAVERGDIAEEATKLERLLLNARRLATFLETVRLPGMLEARLSMVLQRRRPYLAGFEGLLELNRNLAVSLEHPGLETPLECAPKLYQLWGTLQVLEILLTEAVVQGFTAGPQRLLTRTRDGFVLRVLPNGEPVVELDHRERGLTVRFRPEFGFSSLKGTFQSVESARQDLARLRSLTYEKRPDVTIERWDSEGRVALLLLDPKYKREGEHDPAHGREASPVREDLDKMHTYRDAIRDQDGRRVVAYAATLYPGRSELAADGLEIAALPGLPGDSELRGLLQARIGRFLTLGV